MERTGSHTLRRGVSVGGLTVYGIGGMLGGGIYALVGAVAREAGSLAWASFVVAMVVAAPTAMSYVALASRFPRSGGEPHYVQQAFGRPRLGVLIGWLVALSGLVSMATLSVAFAGYVANLVPGAPAAPVIAAFIVGLSLINLRGIRFTSGVNILCTVIEVSGLVIVIVAGAAFLFGGSGSDAGAGSSGADPASTWGVAQGGLLAFYAFIGFEDMVNLAEEVERPRRAYRLAIPLAFATVSAVYITVAVLATQTVPLGVLAGSTAPLGEVVSRGLPELPGQLFDVIALFAVANSALLNCVMASRLLYGMGSDGLLPNWFAVVNRRYGTPHRSIGVVFALSVTLALTGSLAFLAGTTGTILLLVFATVNASLFALLGRGPARWVSPRRVVPAVGAVLSLAMIATAPAGSLAVAAAAVALGLGLGLLHRPTA
jgi:amino acid transporter